MLRYEFAMHESMAMKQWASDLPYAGTICSSPETHAQILCARQWRGRSGQWISGPMGVILPQDVTATKEKLLILYVDSPIKLWITVKRSEDLFTWRYSQKLPGPNIDPKERVGRPGFPLEKRWFMLIHLSSQGRLSWASRISTTFRSNLRQREPKESKEPARDHSSRHAQRECNETDHYTIRSNDINCPFSIIYHQAKKSFS